MRLQKYELFLYLQHFQRLFYNILQKFRFHSGYLAAERMQECKNRLVINMFPLTGPEYHIIISLMSGKIMKFFVNAENDFDLHGYNE